ncbi:MAG: ankyrin repeat domain-containing protein [Candidatus Acidiferrales bacterium]
MKRLPRREFLARTAGAGFVLAAMPPLRSLSGSALSGAPLPEAASLLTSELTNSIAADLLKSETDPFRKAVLTGDLAAVKQYVARDPSLVYSRDAYGQSVYLLAAYAGSEDVTAFLESKGITLDIYESVAGAKMERVNELLNSAPGLLNMPNPAGDTPLHVAAICSRAGVIGNTIMYGPEFSVRNPLRKNATPAHVALAGVLQLVAEDMAFAMIGNGLDPNLATSDGDTILHSAARTGYPRVIRLLLQKGADANARNAAGQSAMDIAQAAGKIEAAEVLRHAAAIPRDYYARRYAYNAKFEALKRDDTEGAPRDFINRSVVVSHFSLERVKKWIELCPALLNTRASWDELPVEAAAHMGRADIGGLLLDRGASYSICTATVFGSLDDAKRMLAEDPKRIHERGAHSFPLLWYTAFGAPRLEAAEYLIGAGADPKEDMRGRTVLHTAATAGHMELCRFYLEKGLDPLQKGASFLGIQGAVEAAEQAKHPEVATMIREWISQHPS